MKYILMLALLSPILYFALRQKKWYLYLLFGLIGFLPEQFALQLHDKLPLISATRLLILLVVIIWLIKNWKAKKLIVPISILIYLGLNLLISLVNLQHGFDEINRMFLFVFERALLVLSITDLIEDRQEIDRCIDFLILGCVVTAIIGIVQTVFEYDIASVLHLTETIASKKIPNRMGLMRAYGTFNAISFGCYCAIMLLPIYYRLESTKKLYYSVAFAITFMAMFCTLTRSAWLCCAAVLFLIVFFHKGKPVRKLLPSVGITILLCASLCLIQPKLYNAIIETTKSTMNTVLSILPDEWRNSAGEEASPEDPFFELDEDFGMNANAPVHSRTQQWSAIEYMTNEGLLVFGYGYNAYPEGKLHYRSRTDDTWQNAHAVDVGFVSLTTESGLLGLVSILGLLVYLFVVAWRRRTKTQDFDFYKLILYFVPLYLLLNVASSFLHKPVIWLTFALFYACHKLDGYPYEKCIHLPKHEN